MVTKGTSSRTGKGAGSWAAGVIAGQRKRLSQRIKVHRQSHTESHTESTMSEETPSEVSYDDVFYRGGTTFEFSNPGPVTLSKKRSKAAIIDSSKPKVTSAQSFLQNLQSHREPLTGELELDELAEIPGPPAGPAPEAPPSAGASLFRETRRAVARVTLTGRGTQGSRKKQPGPRAEESSSGERVSGSSSQGQRHLEDAMAYKPKPVLDFASKSSPRRGRTNKQQHRSI